jgi:radical SAM protein with 4Fe4S-binding SPASM domain
MPPGTLDLFRDRNFIVSVSIDGGATTHDRNRPTKSGRGSFAGILENCRAVRATGDGVTLVARMTVASDTPTLLENVKELWGHNLFDYFQIYPGVTTPGTAGCGVAAKVPARLTPRPEQVGGVKRLLPMADAPATATMNPTFLRQLEQLLDYYPRLFQPGNRFKGVLEYERIAEMVLDGLMAVAHCSAGGTYYTFSPDDSIMPCHRLVGTLEFQVGSGPEGLVRDTGEWTLPVDRHPTCSKCWARYVCGGNCRQENYLATGSLRGLNEETCRYQRRLVESVVRMLAHSGAAYFSAARHLDDLFVSCGRPVVRNRRGGQADSAILAGLQHFRLLAPR